MNRYLAVSHVLTLLETPISETAFAVAVAENPLFAHTCMPPRRWLIFLADEGLLLHQKHSYQLGPLGLFLQRQVLSWVPPTEQQREMRRIAYQARRGQAIFTCEQTCPSCGSDCCALYIFVVLLERLYEGLESWNAWRPGEIELISQALPQTLCPTPQQIFLLAETLSLSKANPSLIRALTTCLNTWPDLKNEPEWRADFELRTQQRLLLCPLPELGIPIGFISRLRLDMGLMKSEQVLYLHALENPLLYPKTAQTLKQLKDLPQAEFIRLYRPGLHPKGNQALLLMAIGPQTRLLFLQRNHQHWQLAKVLLEF